VGIFITDYSEKVLPEFLAHGFTLKHWFGRVNDSLELSFSSGDLKLDIFSSMKTGHICGMAAHRQNLGKSSSEWKECYCSNS
jgi:hypothetical protein